MLNSAKQILAKIASKHGADYLEKIPVMTGNRARVVDAGDGKIWVRFSTGLEARVINTLAPLAPDRHITIGRLRTSQNVWRVAEIRETYLESDSSQFMPHHLQHEFGGFDQVNISRKQIISATAFVSDPANFLVRVYGGLFQTDSGWVLAQSTDGTPAHPDLDLSAEVPTSGAVYVGIESDDTGALSLNVGTPFAAPELATGADVPIPPDGSRLIAFVLLYDSQVELLDSDISVPGLFASAPGSATGGGHVIEDEGTPLTQRTKLNFVGGGITATDDSGDDASVITVSAQTIGDLVEGSTAKATPVDADRFGFWDSVADILKYATWANIKSVLKTYFDTLYQPVDSDLTTIAGLSPTDDDILQRKSGGWINRTLAQLATDMTELIEDIVGGMVSAAGIGSIIVIYNDTTGKLEFSLDNETVQDIVGAMVSGNVESGIDVTYDDTNGKLDFSTTAIFETNANDIFRVDSPGGSSLWTGTINGAPSGASVTVSAPVTGTEAVLVPASTSQLAKIRVRNTTRGNSALISNYNTGTNVMTLTANAPANWANGDSLTIASDTVSGGGYNWVDLVLTAGPTGKTYLWIKLYILSATVNHEVNLHPYVAYSAPKLDTALSQVANVLSPPTLAPYILTSDTISLAWTGTPTRIVLREGGYIK